MIKRLKILSKMKGKTPSSVKHGTTVHGLPNSIRITF